MKQVRKVCSILVFTSFLSLTVLAGEMDYPKPNCDLNSPTVPGSSQCTSTQTNETANGIGTVVEATASALLLVAGNILSIF